MSSFVTIPSPGDMPPASRIGGKAHNLTRLAAVPGVVVPPWFVIETAAFDGIALSQGHAGREQSAGNVRQHIAAMPLPPVLARELRAALTHLNLYHVPLAVRSSSTTEDSAAASFAGQFATVLGVHASDEDLADLWSAIRQVWASTFSDHAVAYARGHEAASVRMAVIVQMLAPARAAGVAFSMDPVSGQRNQSVVSAVYGLGELLVSGECDADTFRVRFDGAGAPTVEVTIAEKQVALVRDRGGNGVSSVRRVDVPLELAGAAAISFPQAAAIASTARDIERVFGAPQDIEWAIGTGKEVSGVLAPVDGETIFVLQARPITAAGGVKEGQRRVWDNSNIVESYGGVTTPLTFSFARGVYEQVYRQFCDVLGVHRSLIDAHSDVFAHMLGLVRGRVYYNLLHWYRVLALLPGYSVNREFMERMMGVRERLADAPPPPTAGQRSRDAMRLLRSIGRLWRAHAALDADIRAFHARVDAALAPVEQADLDGWSADDLVALYRRLDAELLLHWRAPLVNDFFAMIWFGVLGKLVPSWIPGVEPTLVNDLMIGEGNIVSTEPARRVMELASRVVADPSLRARFEHEHEDAALLAAVRADPNHSAFVREFDAFLERFGDRCPGELKLETVTPRENPALAVGMIRAYVKQAHTQATRGTYDERAVRTQAEDRIRASLGPWRRGVLFFVLRNARARVRDRENLRFERTRVFGVVRRIFQGLGQRLHDSRRLDASRDVFYLTTDEVFGAISGTGMTHNLAPVATFRRAEFARYEQEEAPPERFETFGLPDAPPPFVADNVGKSDGDLQGMGCCPGVVRAPVRIVRDPSQAGELSGHIMVAERTDPGWTLLFPVASGLLVQRGSLLSHSAIVAREIGLPCVVAIPGLMNALEDGEWVEMDGATGLVRRMHAPSGHPA